MTMASAGIGTVIVLLSLMPFLTADTSHAVGTLTVASNTPPFATYDHNKPPEQSPGVLTAQAEFCNTGSDPLANVVVHIGNGTTPGTFPTTSFGGSSYSLSMLDAVSGGDVDDATRLLDALAPGACETVYWLLVYPRTGDLSGLVLNWTVWGSGLDAGTERTASTTDSVELRSDISASANKLNPGTFTLTPSGPFYHGQTITVCYTNVDFGIVGSGRNGVNNFTFQPVGNLAFNPDFWQLDVVTSSLVSSKCSGETYNYTDELYYGTINDGVWTPPPGVEACVGNSQNVTGSYCYTFVAINSGTTTLVPYQLASSGAQEKFNGDFGASPLDLVSNQGCAITLVKTADKSNVFSGDTLTYTTTYTNIIAQTLGTPPSMLQITDAIPSGTTYQTGTASCPTGVACTVYFSSDGTNYSTVQPGTVTHLRFVMNTSIPANQVGTVVYSVTVNTNDGVVSGRSASSFDGGPICSESGVVTTTPVTLSYFKAERTGDGARFEWTTATEVGNIGFNIYAVDSSGQRRRLNDRIIPTQQHDGMSPASYVFEAEGVTDTSFIIEDVDYRNDSRTHGIFSAGLAYGSPESVEMIDWDRIRAEDDRQAAVRHERALAETRQRIADIARVRPAGTLDGPGLAGVLGSKVGQPTAAGTVEIPPVARLSISQDGMVRVTHEQLRAVGIDLSSVDHSLLAVVNRGQSVPIRVHSTDLVFGRGSFVEFYGEAADSLYTRTNVYDLVVDNRYRTSIGTFKTASKLTGTPAASYVETLTVDNNRLYGTISPTDDPWYDFRLLVFGAPGSRTVPFSIDNVASGDATIKVKAWGGSEWQGGPDHHFQASVNSTPVVDVRFDGLTAIEPEAPLADGVLQEGVNSLIVTVPGDTGFDYDQIVFDGMELRYPRAFVARDGRLSFTASAKLFRVSKLTGAEVQVYRFEDGKVPVRYDNVPAVRQVDGTYTAMFEGTGTPARYDVLSVTPDGPGAISAVREAGDIATAGIDYVMIAHPNFIEGIQPLVDHHRASGLEVKVVDLRDVYDRYGHGLVDPLAIKAYLADARADGVSYALLVGGDTYDYLNYASPGAMSFIPTLYARTDRMVHYAPVDPLFADVDDDGVPDMAIGRFPVKTQAELDGMVGKTLAYVNKTYGRSAVFAADAVDPQVDFTRDSESFIAQLPGGWGVERAHIDEVGLATARARVIGKINEGVALTSYVGHSSATAWTFDGLFNSNDASLLTNAGRPTVVAQWGCWNTYFVSPLVTTLGNALLLNGDRGAAAVLGATTLTQARSEEMLGALVMPRIALPGTTIGEAVLGAKQQLATTHPDLVDVLLGWTILGDPAIEVER